jgi:thiol-disulfide isomerase/thioredoxin
VKPEETDILAVASAAWSQLTPAQRDLTYPALLQRLELWPYRVKLLLPYNLDNQKTRVGDPALLLGLEGNQLLVRHERTTLAFNVDPQETDLMAQARLLVTSESGAPGRVIEEFAGKIASPLTGQAVKLDESARPKYVVMYMGAGWCGPCLTFSPKLVKMLKAKAPKPADVTVLYLSGDKSPAEAKGYMTKLGVDWPTIYFKNRGQLPAFGSLFGDVIPQLVVTDRHGRVLIDSSKTGYDQALAQLEKML